MAKKPIPYSFVLEELEGVSPHTKPMFGSYGVYVGAKIVLILRERDQHPDDNGIWLATVAEHHPSLKRDFPNLRSLKLFGPGPTGWQLLPSDADDFEESALHACKLVLSGDPRIGKIPKPRSPRKPK